MDFSFSKGLAMFHSCSVKFLGSEQGATSVEYAVMLALILVAIFTAITALGSSSSGIWANDASQIQNALGAS
jgi:pilus assembly protein Flp/PilA